MPKIIKNGLEYSGVPVEVVTAWAPTADPVQVKEPLMGNTDISEIGDGSITGAISEINAGLTVTFYSESLLNGTMFFKKSGNVKTIYFQISPSSDVAPSQTWFTLPEQFRPIISNVDTVVDFAVFHTDGTFAGIIRFNGATGAVTAEFTSFKAGTVRSTFTYI